MTQTLAHRIEQRDIGAGSQLQMQIGQPRQLRAPGIDDDQGHPSPMRLLDPGPDHGMGLRRIRPHHHNQLGQIEILNGIGRRRSAERFHHAGDGRAVADAGTVVDVVRPDHATHELAEQIILFVRAPAG